MPHLLIHVENYDREGILPSQLVSIRLTAHSLGHGRLAFVDATCDGVTRFLGWERFSSLASFLDAEAGPLIVFESAAVLQGLNPTPADSAVALLSLQDAWIVIGPAGGLSPAQFKQRDVAWCTIPARIGGGRDAVVIALWELRWPR
jgi:hypothetical protein